MTKRAASQPPPDVEHEGDERKCPDCGHRRAGIPRDQLANWFRRRFLGKPALPPTCATGTQWNDVGDVDMCDCTNDAHYAVTKGQYWVED